jgi:aminopeptidase N
LAIKEIINFKYCFTIFIGFCLKNLFSAIIPLVCSFYFTFNAFTNVVAGGKSLSAKSSLVRPAFYYEDAEENYIVPGQLKLDILHYDIDITLQPEIKNINAVVIITGVLKEKGMKAIDLNFYDNMKISEAFLDGVKTEFVNKGARLTFQLPEGYSKDTFNLKIAYSGKPKNLGLSSFVFGEINNKSLVYSLNEPNYASTWFPCNDTPSDKAFLDMRITGDTSKVSVSNGKLIEVVTRGDKRTYHWKTYYPIATYLICLYSSAYEVVNDNYISGSGDTLGIYYYVLPEHKKNAQKDFEDHPQFLKAFSELFGEYPFMKEKYGVAEFLWQMGAMESQTITGVGSNLVNGRKFFNDVYVHELAHHWWGDAVSPASWKDIWLNEGFATYSEALYFEKVSGAEALRSTMNSKYGRNFREKLYDTDGDLFSRTIYNKGAWVLHMLRREMGDSSFFAMLRGYFQKFKYSNASTEDFRKICEEYSGLNFNKFFDQWVYDGVGIIECSYSWNAAENGKNYKVEVQLKQIQREYPVYEFPLDIKLVYNNGGKSVIKQVRVNSASQKFVFEVDEKPDNIVFDPDNWLLAYFISSADLN